MNTRVKRQPGWLHLVAACICELFPECSLNVSWFLNVPRMFPECSLNVPRMFPECSLNVPWMFTECPSCLKHCPNYIMVACLIRRSSENKQITDAFGDSHSDIIDDYSGINYINASYFFYIFFRSDTWYYEGQPPNQLCFIFCFCSLNLTDCSLKLTDCSRKWTKCSLHDLFKTSVRDRARPMKQSCGGGVPCFTNCVILSDRHPCLLHSPL
jgi:hypothetical protein